ncbi:MAG TPA: beta-galactosidase GalA [Candidatus Binatia bacterium]|nr:beta-galactosidase GalA [Candidatus Binatia bacterium]
MNVTVHKPQVLWRAASLAVFLSLAAIVSAADLPRARLLLDFNWKFHLGDPGFEENIINAGVNEGPAGLKFNESHWRTVNLPHDWAVELPFDPNADASHGYKPLGHSFPTNSIGWYRRSFALSKAEKGKRLWLEFDGVYRNCRVFLNGYKLIHHESGYNSFRCDITDTANYGGKNVVAVRVDASEFEGWFYEGAGIYRHVWLVKTAPLAISPDGIFVYSAFPNHALQGPATIHLQTWLSNRETNSAAAKVNWRILGRGGETVAAADATARMDSGGKTRVEGTAKVATPVLWSPEAPELYKLVTTVESGGQVVDREETEFGIRTIAFDPEKGFLLNGRHYEIKGTCNHQDHAGVGTALPDALNYFRVQQLKKMGCNAIRTSHNEPTAELLEACDHLGLLVMDETRNFASDPRSLANLKQQVCRDRNHASVFIWSLANEEPLQLSDADEAITITMRKLVHKLDPTRLCTAAIYNWPTGKPYGISAGIDVQGFNYFDQGDTDAFHKNNPDKPSIGTEEGMAQYTRGVYENTKTYLSADDIQKPDCRHTAETSIKYYAARPWIAGMFFWTGFDYRGEPSPFGWPNISSDFGILDTCGFPKDVFYYLQSCWSDKTALHLLPHWTWTGKEGQDIDVRAFSNCDKIELFLNGQGLGRKVMPKNSHLEWKVKYAPGTLAVKGYRAGRVVAEERIETAGVPFAIKLMPDPATIHADGQDLSFITVAAADAQGRLNPVADNLIHFTLSGPGRILGVGNGDPASHEADVYFDQRVIRTLAVSDWRIEKLPQLRDPGAANGQRPPPVDCPEIAVGWDDSHWEKANPSTQEGPLHPGEMAVFRAHLLVSAGDLAVAQARLHFGMIDDDGWLYVNGQFAGEAHNWSADPEFAVLNFLHPGDNTVAVIVKNQEGPGGINKGVTLELERPSASADWQRRLFNGLAQIIVQSDTQPGQVRITARAEGLSASTVVIQTKPSRSGAPSVP